MVPAWKRNGAGVPAPTGFRIVRMYEQTIDAQNGSDASNNEETTLDDLNEGDEVEVEYNSAHSDERQHVAGTVTSTCLDLSITVDAGDKVYTVTLTHVRTCGGELRVSDRRGGEISVKSPVTDGCGRGSTPSCPACGSDDVKEGAAAHPGDVADYGCRACNNRWDDAVIMTDGGEAGCPHGNAYCEGADSPAEKPELCFECWDEWAAYEPEMLDESEQWDPETDPRPQVKADYDAGTDAGIVEDTCAIPNCDDEPIEGERRGLCDEHAADDVDRGEEIMTDGGAKSVEFTAPGNSIGTEVEPGTVIELPYNGGMWTVSAVKEPALARITEYHVEPVTGGEGQIWKEYELENAFDAGASIIGGES